MTNSVLTIYNGALSHLRQRPLDTVTDAELSRYTLDANYAKAKATVLESGLWNFAARTVAIDSDTDIESQFGYAFAFDKPDDFKRLIKIAGNELLFPTLDMYVDEGAFWFANVDPLFVSYVSDGVTYGGDLSLWTQKAVGALEYELACLAAPTLTQMSRAEMAELRKAADKALSAAKSLDASGQPVEFAQPGRLFRARGGYMGRYWRDRNMT